MHNIKVSKHSTKEKKQRKRLTHIQTETKPNTKILNKKTEQPQQQNKTKLENLNNQKKKNNYMQGAENEKEVKYKTKS